MRILSSLVLILALGMVLALQNAVAETWRLNEDIRGRIEASGIPPKLEIGGHLVYVSMMLRPFYQRRGFLPAWIDEQGPLELTYDLIQAIRGAESEGLKPEYYHIEKIESILMKLRKDEKSGNQAHLIDLDFMLTNAFLTYASNLLYGRANPGTYEQKPLYTIFEPDIPELLEVALRKSTINQALKDLSPYQPGYVRLRVALARYREIAGQGGWSVVPPGSNIKKGDIEARVLSLRKRLVATGDLPKEFDLSGELFDDALDQDVRGFQRRHGLVVDGIVGPATLAALNVPVGDRVIQIELNMERRRWLPKDLGELYVLVNIANFELEVVEKQETVIDMRAIVGRSCRPSPLLKSQINYLVLSPSWTIPKVVLREDVLPIIRKNPDYFAKNHIRVYEGFGPGAKEIDPRTVDWSKVSARNIRYRLIQEPGPLNAMGRVKFVFPNEFDVFIHDTPAQELFEKTDRAFSSGCIRIEKPIELAEYLLRDKPKWSRKEILAEIDKRVEQTVDLQKQVLLYMVYWTVWVDEDGTMQFRSDIYGRDKALKEKLQGLNLMH